MRSISLAFAKKGIEDFFAEKKSPNVRFFAAGEPTIEFGLMQVIWDHSHRLAGDVLYTELQTNGYFDEYVRRWIAEHIDMVWISCDGPSAVQDLMRPRQDGRPASPVIEKNIKAFVAAGKRIGIRATISGINIYRQTEMIDFFSSLGVTAVFADIICLPVATSDRKKSIFSLQVDPLEYTKRFLDAKRYAEQKGLFYSNSLMINFDEHVSIPCRCLLPSPHLNPSGYVSSCDMATELTGTAMDDLIYGYYDRQKSEIIYSESKITKLRSRSADRIPACKDCDVRWNCAGNCVGEAINETGNFWGIKQELCEAIRFLARSCGTNYTNLFEYLHP